MAKKYLYESVVGDDNRFNLMNLGFSFPKLKIFLKIKEYFLLSKTLVAVLLSGFSLAAIFLFNWIFILIFIPSAFLAVANFAEDYKLIKLKEDFEENGIF